VVLAVSVLRVLVLQVAALVLRVAASVLLLVADLALHLEVGHYIKKLSQLLHLLHNLLQKQLLHLLHNLLRHPENNLQIARPILIIQSVQ